MLRNFQGINAVLLTFAA